MYFVSGGNSEGPPSPGEFLVRLIPIQHLRAVISENAELSSFPVCNASNFILLAVGMAFFSFRPPCSELALLLCLVEVVCRLDQENDVCAWDDNCPLKPLGSPDGPCTMLLGAVYMTLSINHLAATILLHSDHAASNRTIVIFRLVLFIIPDPLSKE